MRHFSRRGLLSVLLLGTAGCLAAPKPIPPRIYVDQHGVAISGYDVVSYFLEQRPVKGSARWSATHLGATFHFSSQEHRDRFLQNPESFVPQFGGHCAYSLGKGIVKQCDPRAFSLRDGKLYLFNNRGAENRWRKDEEGYIAKAFAYWRRLVE